MKRPQSPIEKAMEILRSLDLEEKLREFERSFTGYEALNKDGSRDIMPDGSLRSDIEGSSYEGYSNIRDNNHSDFINTEGLSSEAYSNSSFRDFSNEVSRNNSDEGMSEQKDKKASKSAAPSSSDFFNPLESMDNESVLKGIIYSEILGKPVSKRKGSRF